jgi:hypothetical protein
MCYKCLIKLFIQTGSKILFISFLLIGDTLKKKSDDAPSEHRSFKAYLATLTLDFLVIVVPMLLFFTVSVSCSIKCFASKVEFFIFFCRRRVGEVHDNEAIMMLTRFLN